MNTKSITMVKLLLLVNHAQQFIMSRLTKCELKVDDVTVDLVLNTTIVRVKEPDRDETLLFVPDCLELGCVTNRVSG